VPFADRSERAGPSRHPPGRRFFRKSSAREIEIPGAVIAEAGGSAAVFGMSSGAVLALDAATAGLPITALALYEPPFVVDDRRPPVAGDYLARVTAMIAEGRRGEAVELFMTQPVATPPEIAAQMRAAPFWPALEAVAPTLPYDGAFMEGTMRGGPLWAALAAA
jgi:hypothetical protein